MSQSNKAVCIQSRALLSALYVLYSLLFIDKKKEEKSVLCNFVTLQKNYNSAVVNATPTRLDDYHPAIMTMVQ